MKIKTRIVTPHDKELWNKCERLEYSVFQECGYISENTEQRLVDYDSYSPTEIIAAFDVEASDNPLVGIWRMIYSPNEKKMRHGLFPTLDSPDKLKLYPDALPRLVKMNPKQFVDLSAAAIDIKYRTGEVSKALFKRVMSRAWEKPPVIYGLGAPDTHWLERVLKRGYPLEILGPSSMYWGSYTTPILIDTYTLIKKFKLLILPFIYYRLKGSFNGKNQTGN
jgi:hypothetical protein